MSYDPHGSGHLKGSGKRKPRRQRDVGWANISISDRTAILEGVPDYEEGCCYSEREKLLLAEKILRSDSKSPQEFPTVLFYEHLKERWKREIYTANGTPDPSVASGLYWRTHPEGRKVNSDDQRKRNGAGFYR